MKNHPILFSTSMVAAILDGRKTQTRRVIKTVDRIDEFLRMENDRAIFTDKILDLAFPLKAPHLISTKCKYGQPGDQLWLREKLDMWPGDIFYSADGEFCEIKDLQWFDNWSKATVPAIFMPRWASRITLEIVNVRVERVQEISEADVIAEGIGAFTLARGVLSDAPPDPRWKFIELWEELNKKRGYGWEARSWVWVIEFKRL